MLFNSAARDEADPTFERTTSGIVAEFGNFPGDDDEGFLCNVLGFGFGETGACGQGGDEFAVQGAELAPGVVVVGVLEAAQEAGAGGEIGS